MISLKSFEVDKIKREEIEYWHLILVVCMIIGFITYNIMMITTKMKNATLLEYIIVNILFLTFIFLNKITKILKIKEGLMVILICINFYLIAINLELRTINVETSTISSIEIVFIISSALVYSRLPLFSSTVGSFISIFIVNFVYNKNNYYLDGFIRLIIYICMIIIAYNVNKTIRREKKLSKKLKEAKVLAEVANKAKSTFLANMSHEIRTPMNSIIGMSYLVLQTKLDEKQKEYLEKLKNSATSLISILNDVLDFSKIEAGKLLFENKEVDIYKVLDEIASVNTVYANAKGLEIFVDIKENSKQYLILDSLRISQVLNNLVNNAIKFTDEGYILISYNSTVISEDGVKCEISVKDTGIGMNDDSIKNIFQNFSQADSSITRKFGGTGLGLVISKSIVEEYNGNISVKSSYMKGSEFILNIYFKESKKLNDIFKFKDEIAKKQIFLHSSSSNTKNIMTNIFNSLGVKIFEISSYRDILKELKTDKDDSFENKIIFIDFGYSDKIDIERFQKFYSLSNKNSVKIIFMIIYIEKNRIKILNNIGFNKFVTKPLNTRKIFEILNQNESDESIFNEIKKGKDERYKNIDFTNKYVLVVEDDNINFEVVRELLLNHKANVDGAECSKKAVELVKEKRYSLIIMDISLPDLDGYKTLMEIRKIDNYNDIPVVALTARAMKTDIEMAKKYGFAEHISKPLKPKEFLETICKYIGSEVIGEDNYDEEIQESIKKDLYKLIELIDKQQPVPCRKIIDTFYDKETSVEVKLFVDELKDAIGRFDFKKAKEISYSTLEFIDNKVFS